jgi:hypothetical protein
VKLVGSRADHHAATLLKVAEVGSKCKKQRFQKQEIICMLISKLQPDRVSFVLNMVVAK